jgi:co-chaperonin GroES (HSP10)
LLCIQAETNSICAAFTEGRSIIERFEEVEEARSGLYIPDTAKEKPQQGEVKAPR